MAITISGDGTMQQMASGGITGGATLTAGTAVTASGTSIDFTGIPSWVKRITVMLTGVSTNGSSTLIIRLGTLGGFLTSGYLGSCMQISSTGSATANTTTGIGLQLNPGAASIFHSVTTINNITGNTWVASGTGAFSDGAATTATGCTVPLSGVLTQLRIQPANGTDTFDAGSINILYE